jgi:hypothetical protein
VEFIVGEEMFLRVSPTKGFIGFNIKEKISLRFILSPESMKCVHNMLHCSMLLKHF